MTLIAGTVVPMPVYKNRLAPVRSAVDRMWSRISTKIGSSFKQKQVELCSSCRPTNSVRALKATRWKCNLSIKG